MNERKIVDSNAYWSCSYIESGVTIQNAGLMFCCERKNPNIVFPENRAEETVNAFLKMRQSVIEDNQKHSAPCKGCPLFQKKEWGGFEREYKIDYLNFGVQSYCQFSCIYCSLQRDDYYRKGKNQPEPFDSLAIVKEFERRGMFSDHLKIDYASGEIAIHPQKEEYLRFIDNNAYTVAVSSNAGKYDEGVSAILKKNKRNSITVSLDAGKKETFALVHGTNRFDAVIANLKRYKEEGAQIYLKYILLEENCDKENIEKFIEICKEIGVVELEISGDSMLTRDFSVKSDPKMKIIQGAIWLAEGAIEKGIPFRTINYLGTENIKAIYKKLALNEKIKEREKRLDYLLQQDNLIFYGAGKNCEILLKTWAALKLKQPKLLWDISAKETGEIGATSEYRWGYALEKPNFSALDSLTDAVFITLTNGEINNKLIENMNVQGFKEVLSWDDLQMALIAKMAATDIVL